MLYYKCFVEANSNIIYIVVGKGMLVNILAKCFSLIFLNIVEQMNKEVENEKIQHSNDGLLQRESIDQL